MKRLALLLLPLIACGCQDSANNAPDETADQFVERINRELAELSVEGGAAGWVRATYITHDTAILSSLARQRYAAWHSKTVADSLRFSGQDMSAASARALQQLKLGISAPAPNDAEKRKELAEITTELAGMYGAGKYCPEDGRDCMDLGKLEDIMAKSRDYDENLDAWVGWRKISPPMRDKYRRFAELANEGAGELGYANLGEMWRAEYDMSPVEFETEALRLYNQVKPLYDELHCYARDALARHYGEDKVPPGAPIPAHLLGNMWAQTWDNIYDLLEPYPWVADVDVDRDRDRRRTAADGALDQVELRCLVDHQHRRRGGVGLGELVDLPVGRLDRLLQDPLGGRVGKVAVERLRGGLRGNIARLRAAHPVGDDEDRGANEEGVLVGVSLPAGVGAERLLVYPQHWPPPVSRPCLMSRPRSSPTRLISRPSNSPTRLKSRPSNSPTRLMSRPRGGTRCRRSARCRRRSAQPPPSGSRR